MNLGLSHCLALVCDLCGEMVDDSVAIETALFVELFGAARYATCPCCGQPTASRANSKRWQKRVEKFLEKKGVVKP